MNPATAPGDQSLNGVVKAVVETSPPVALSAWHYLAGQPIEKWLTAITIFYVILQAVVLVRKEFWKRKGRRK
jgi:hypothetical protein